ncbi:MAG: hypothetical protein ACYTFY_20370, partial [Planctomycetota bacterium]|jgi:hypothetical protein
MNNHKQFVIAISLYADENADYFPHHYRSDDPSYNTNGTRNWFEVFFQNDYIEKKITRKESSAGNKYWAGNLVCPSCENLQALSGSGLGTDFALNLYVYGSNNGHVGQGFKIYTIKKPSETYFCAEAYNDGANSYALKWYWGDAYMHFPHNEQTVMQYIGGNVSTLREEDLNPVLSSGSPGVVEWRGY